MKQRKEALACGIVAVLGALFAAVWLYVGLFGETSLLGRTSLFARAGDVLFGLILLSGAVIWAVRAWKLHRTRDS